MIIDNRLRKFFVNKIEHLVVIAYSMNIDSLAEKGRGEEKKGVERSMDVDAKCEPRYISVDRYVASGWAS